MYILALAQYTAKKKVSEALQYTTILPSASFTKRCASMLSPRAEMSSAAWNMNIYIFGNSPYYTRTLSASYKYNLCSDSWSQIANMPTGRGMTAAAAVNAIVYVFGGNNSNSNKWLNTVEGYDTRTNKWKSCASLPGIARGLLSACTVGDNIYVMGGLNSYVVPDSSDNFVYDTHSNSWRTASSLPRPRAQHGAVVLNDKIYLIGGSSRYSHGEMLFPTEVDVYDPSTNSWSQAAPLPNPRYLPKCAVYSGKIYVIGGGNAHAGASAPSLSIVDVYDPDTNTWMIGKELPEPRQRHCAVSVDGRLFVIGGSDNRGNYGIYDSMLELVHRL